MLLETYKKNNHTDLRLSASICFHEFRRMAHKCATCWGEDRLFACDPLPPLKSVNGKSWQKDENALFINQPDLKNEDEGAVTGTNDGGHPTASMSPETMEGGMRWSSEQHQPFQKSFCSNEALRRWIRTRSMDNYGKTNYLCRMLPTLCVLLVISEKNNQTIIMGDGR